MQIRLTSDILPMFEAAYMSLTYNNVTTGSHSSESSMLLPSLADSSALQLQGLSLFADTRITPTLNRCPSSFSQLRHSYTVSEFNISKSRALTASYLLKVKFFSVKLLLICSTGFNNKKIIQFIHDCLSLSFFAQFLYCCCSNKYKFSNRFHSGFTSILVPSIVEPYLYRTRVY